MHSRLRERNRVKLVIQIPCYNEEAQLPRTVRELPQAIPGIDRLEIVVIDDGSTDRTVEVARELGARVVCVASHRGLAHAFATGLEASLTLGADVIVNTDADNQYRGADVAALVAPIVAGDADLVIGARPIGEIAAFSVMKKFLQHLGSWAVGRLSGTRVADATSGFRAMNREAALQLNVFSRYTYTLETIIQAAHHGLRVVSVPVRVNERMRASRLVRGNLDYMWCTASALVRVFVVYWPFRSFMAPALVLFAIATIIALRFLYYFLEGGGTAGHVQSLILAAILYGLSGMLMAVAFLGDLLAINRRLLEELQLEARRARLRAAERERADG
ncbi:MAG: glycosyltransferase family 2 protein [Pseudomonadota bacterium]|nr:glycosyltransferase family 2 protein [Pseudomonadota bacterium]